VLRPYHLLGNVIPFLGNDEPLEAGQGQAVLGQHGQIRHRPGQHHIIAFPVRGVLSRLFGAGVDDLHASQPEITGHLG